MKIESNVLEEFLKIIRMNEVEQCLMNFNDKGLEITAASQTAHNMGSGLLEKKHFKDYTELGSIGVDDLSKLKNILKKNKGDVELSVKGNVMQMSFEKKELEFSLVDEKYIEKSPGDKEIPFDTVIRLSAEQLNDFFSDISINTDEVIHIHTVDKGFKLFNSGKYKFTHNIDSEETKEGTKVNFKEPFFNTLTAVKKGDVTLQIKTDYPATVFYETETAKYKFIIAPRVDN